MSADKQSARQSVLYEVNQVLVKAGLNDTVWSIRDCDSTLFVLIFKKLVGKVSAENMPSASIERLAAAAAAAATTALALF